MLYENQFTANSRIATLFETIFDGSLVNTSAEAVIASPHFGVRFDNTDDWLQYRFGSTIKMFKGISFGKADMGNPSGFYWTNEAYAAHRFSNEQHLIFSGIKRIEVSNSLQESLGSGHYYEWSLGWVANEPTRFKWIKNLGVGININYGSQLSGASLRLLINH